jgi:hypothetical protein
MDANKYASVSLPEHHALVLGALDGIKESLSKHSKEEAMSTGEHIKVENIFKRPEDGGGVGALLPALLAGNGGLGGNHGAAWGLGGLVLGSLLNNRNGGLFGGNNGADGTVVAGAAVLDKLGDIQAQIGTSASHTENVVTSSAAGLTNTILNQTIAFNSTLGQLATGVQQGLCSNKEATISVGTQILQAISNDGEKTRALLTSQNEANLNRQLAEANAAIVELRSEHRIAERGRQTEVNVTQNVNQNQAQQQQQQQFMQFGNALALITGELQNIRATNQAINIGAGTQTANPANTNTNTRVN